jgi:hypothetical protein
MDRPKSCEFSYSRNAKRRYAFTFFGLQRFFFLFATTPQSLQRKSPGFALRRGLSFEHDIVFSLSAAEVPIITR